MPVTDAALREMIQAALIDAARRAAPGAVPPALVSAARVTWRDGAIGCPEPGMMYTMALVPGYLIRVRSGNAVLDYHAALRGAPVLCPPGRATEPVADSRI